MGTRNHLASCLEKQASPPNSAVDFMSLNCSSSTESNYLRSRVASPLFGRMDRSHLGERQMDSFSGKSWFMVIKKRSRQPDMRAGRCPDAEYRQRGGRDQILSTFYCQPPFSAWSGFVGGVLILSLSSLSGNLVAADKILSGIDWVSLLFIFSKALTTFLREW